MTETDATRKPLEMPQEFIPYLEKYRIYKLFKDMMRDLVINLPRDHLKHMKVFLSRRLHCSKDADRVILLVSPELSIDHPCTVREARTLQQDGVLPTVTLVVMPAPPVAPRAPDHLTPHRNFFQQDFEGLKYAYKATLKEVYIDPDDELPQIANKCFNAVRACASGLQGPRQGSHAGGAPGTYRVLLLGARGSGRRSQAQAVAKHFGLVYLHFQDMANEVKMKKNEIGEKLRSFGTSPQIRAEIVRQRLKQKDCVDNGWVMTGFPTCGKDFEILDTMSTPPNRIIFLNADMATCKARILPYGVDWCTGEKAPLSEPRVLPQPDLNIKQLDDELEFFFSEALAELRAAAGLTAVEIDAMEPFDKVHVKIQAAIMSAPTFDIEISSQLRNARGD